MGKYYITTAIAYTSRVPHIGNTYEAVLADAIARYRRLIGDDVYFLTGTDEHGQKIQDQAKAAGITPQEHVDNIAGEIRRIWDFMNVSYDQFIRTTDPKHMAIVQKMFKRLYDQGDIYKGEYKGLYCVADEAFYTESQTVNGKCPECGGDLKPACEEAYFFKISKYAKQLEEYIESHPDFIQPESRKNEMLNNFIRPGLQDLCVSRTSFNWGIPVTFDDKHVIYVWIDALSNYITALGYDPDGNHDELFKHYWPANVHLIGKDILRFHTIYWPIMLMALGVELPKQVFGHPWLLMGEEKMSKSKGNVVYAEDLVKLFGVDATRYYMLHEMPFAQDGSFTFDLIMSRTNADLANIFGNLVARTLAMAGKYFDGKTPVQGELTDLDRELITLAEDTPKRVTAAIEKLRVADALDEIWVLLRRSNKYIDETTPWTLAKDEASKPRLATVIYNLLESIRIAAVLLTAFLPASAERVLTLLNTDVRDYDSTLKFGGLKAGTELGASEVLFARIDEKAKQTEIETLFAERAVPAEADAKPLDLAPEVGIEDFEKVDLRVAKVIECEKVPKSDKLLKLTIELGSEKRQVVSGIAKWYQPADLIGRKIVMVANLKPVKLRGVESQGMIIATDASEDDVRVIFVDDDVPSGSKVR